MRLTWLSRCRVSNFDFDGDLELCSVYQQTIYQLTLALLGSYSGVSVLLGEVCRSKHNDSMSQKEASIATDLHTQYELDDVSQSSSWSHRLALTATHCHLQSKLGVLLAASPA